MLTPKFSLSQSEGELIVKIHAPFSRISDTDIDIDENTFIFYSSPYYLRLTLPGKLIDSEKEVHKATFDVDEQSFIIKCIKQTFGEHFEGLDMLTQLLTPRGTDKVNKPLIEVIDGDIFNRLQKGSKLSEKYFKKGKENYKSKGENTGSENELQESVHEGNLPLKDLNPRPLEEKLRKEPPSPTPQQVVHKAQEPSTLQKEPTHTHEEPGTDLKDDASPEKVTTIDLSSRLFPGNDQNKEPEVDKDILVFEEPLTKANPGVVLTVITPVDVVAAEVEGELQASEEGIDDVSPFMISKHPITISEVAPEKPQPMASVTLEEKSARTEAIPVMAGVSELSVTQEIPTETLFSLQEGEEDSTTEEPEMTDSASIDTTTPTLGIQEGLEGEVLRSTATEKAPSNPERLVTQIKETIENLATESPEDTQETATLGFSQEVTPEVNSEATQVDTQEETPEGSLEANLEGDEDTSLITQETPMVTQESIRKVTLGQARDTTLDFTQEESDSIIQTEEELATTTSLPQPMVDPIELIFKDETELETDLIHNDTFI